jgi:creatinine amidohydrolase
MLSELSYGDIKGQPPFDVAVLPLGATEPHNLHLPYATDTLQVEVVADRVCERAFDRGARVIRLPALPYGTETNQMRFPLAMNVNPSTMAALLTDLIGSLETHGIHKCVLLNGHGGNDLKWFLREKFGTTKVQLFLCNWYKVGSDRYGSIFEQPDDHAGEMETSMGLAYFPSLVSLDRADAGSLRASRFDAVRRGWVEITRAWHLLTTNSGAGDPRAATAEKGRAYAELVVQRLSDFIVGLAQSPLDETFPFAPDRPTD